MPRRYAGPEDPLWFKDATIYELHVRAFRDGNGDGVGDFRGLTQNLDYLEDLGVDALWLLPFYPSPLRDDGYDIADYTDIHPAYGTLADFKAFLREAHRRDIKVITELVINHTSDRHPWFRRAREAPRGSPQRDFYVWSDDPTRYADARIIFKDFESSNWTWDPVAEAYYWHRFYHHQPDLNFDNPRVRKAIKGVLDFWLRLGVDGLRLDAVPYLFEREGTSCENLPETHDLLRDLRAHVDRNFRNRMLLAEANQWPEDSAAYFGEGDECHMAFHFPLMPRIFMALRMEDSFPITDILAQTPQIPETCQWALFLRNHDELTLEMVTDEERDYMYRAYAHDPQARINLGIRRRLAPLVGNDRRRIELLHGLLLSLPGTPVLYYGDEIGMGDNIFLGDRNGVRTPMQWSSDRNAGFSRCNPQRLFLPVVIDPEYHYEAINVEAQQANVESLLWWIKRLVALRQRHRAFGRGSLRFLPTSNRKVLAFVRSHEDEDILVVANLSRFVQAVELDLSEIAGRIPVELSGHTEMPPIGQLPYFLTPGPHAFFWFLLKRAAAPQVAETGAEREARLPRLQAPGLGWEALLGERARGPLEEVLPAYMVRRRWFRGKSDPIVRVTIEDTVPLSSNGAADRSRGDGGGAGGGAILLVLAVESLQGEPARYLLPVSWATGEQADRIIQERPGAAVARVRDGTGREGVLFDALAERETCLGLLAAIERRRRFRGERGHLVAMPTRAFRRLARRPDEAPDEPRPADVEQTNTSIVYDERFILKVFRKLEPGINPDLEIGRRLTETIRFEHAPKVAGSLEYRDAADQPMTVGLLQAYVANRGDAWSYTLDELARFFERVVTEHRNEAEPPLPDTPLVELADAMLPEEADRVVGGYLESARLLGRRTAQLHVALATVDDGDPAFAPEPFGPMDRRSLYQALRARLRLTVAKLRERIDRFPDATRPQVELLIEREEELRERAAAILDRKIAANRIRCHGDYHLGQVLHTGRDFVIIDFEGEPARSLGERRLKRPALRDVAGMLRSFDYAASAALRDLVWRGVAYEEDWPSLRPWSRAWQTWVSAAFLFEYRLVVAESEPGLGLLPLDTDDAQLLLDVFVLDKAVYELSYEIDTRPGWAWIPLDGILRLLPEPAARPR